MTVYKTIADLPAAAAASDADLFETEQTGSSRAVTFGQMSASILSDVAGILASGGATPLSSVAALKALTIRPSVVITRGYGATNDGGGGPPWVWVAGSSAVADDFMVVSPAGTPTGRYIRQLQAGAAVSPKWAGCGLGAADDSAQFQKVINFGRAIDASGGTYPVMNLIVALGSACPGIFSDGSGTFVPAPSATSTTVQVAVQKVTGGFYFRRLRFIGEITTHPTIPPICDRPIYFAHTGFAEDCEVSHCHFEGYSFGVVLGDAMTNGRVVSNYFKGQWREAISGPNAMNGLWIDDNMFFDGGYATGAPSPSGAIRIGLGAETRTCTHVSICRNHIARWSVPTNQSSIDCASGNLGSLDISDNIIEDTGGSIECKTGNTAGVYQRINISNNLIKLPEEAVPVPRTGITVFYAEVMTAPNAGKGNKVVVEGNKIWSATRQVARIGSLGIFVNGFDNVDIKNNTIFNINQGIRVDATNVSGVDTAYNYTISGNTVDVVETAVTRGTGTIVNLNVNNNPLLRADITTIAMNTATRNFSIAGNYIESRALVGIELRDVHDGIVTNNVVFAAQNALLHQAASGSSVIVTRNHLRTFVDPNALPVAAITCTAPGAGLTNGVRTFTVTNGTGTVPTIFQFTVVGGSVTGTVTILQYGAYSVFPTVPTVTVDSGIVGGATFAMTAVAASTALVLSGTPVGWTINDNRIEIPDANITIAGTGYGAASNCRGLRATDPTGVVSGARGDYFLNSAPVSAGFEKWICTVSTGTWKGSGLIA